MVVFSFLLFACSSNADGTAKEKTSPFSSFNFDGEDILVGLDGKEYTIVSMDSINFNSLVSVFKRKFGGAWQKRMSEDFVEYCNELTIFPESVEQFVLRDQEGNQQEIHVEFTRAKREDAKGYFKSNYDREIDLDRSLTKAQAIADLKQLETAIDENYSYYFLNDVDYKKELEALAENLPDEILTSDFALVINPIILKFGDGHSRLYNVNFKQKGTLPFRTAEFNNQIVCFNKEGFLDADHPYLLSINGVGVDKLLVISERYLTTDASPQFKKLVRASRLSRIGLILEILGQYDETLKLVLGNDNGQTIEKQLPIVTYKKAIRDDTPFNPFEAKMLDDIAYLKIASMETLRDPSFYNEAIGQLENAKAVIIDVRDNGGGKRDILLSLAPNFISTEQEFIVGNIARLRSDFPEEHISLKDRYIYQLEDHHFNAAQKSNIQTFMKDFVPSIKLDEAKYSPYYYLYLESKNKALFPETPTVVLMDAGCYSATDIFLSAFKEIDQVTLIGTKSGGGSGRTQGYKLRHSAIDVSLSSIASFQPSGELYDGIGVAPDIMVEQKTLSDFIGTTDHQLDYAVDYLKALIK